MTLSRRIGRSLRGAFVAGLLLTIPFLVSAFVVYTAADFLDSRARGPVKDLLGRPVPGIGLASMLVLVLLIGYLARSFLGRLLFRWAELLIHRIPVVRQVYDAVKQIAQLLMGGSGQSFQRVVLVEFPRPGMRAIGLVTNDVEVREKNGKRRRYAGVFVPTNHLYLGHFVLIPDEELVHLDMPVAQAMKTILSVGSAAPPSLEETRTPTRRRKA